MPDASAGIRSEFVFEFRESRYRPTFEEIGACMGLSSEGIRSIYEDECFHRRTLPLHVSRAGMGRCALRDMGLNRRVLRYAKADEHADPSA
jgi:hypothetical protein